MGKLTEKRKRFVIEYLKDFNAKQAAIRAGYSPKVATVEGSRLLRFANVRAAIDRKKTKITEAADVTVEKIVKEAALIAFSDLSQFLANAEQIKDPSEWPEEVRRGVQSFKVVKTAAGDVRTEIKTWDKTAMLEFLGKYLGMLKDKGDAPQVVLIGADDFDKEPGAGVSDGG